MTLPEVCVVYLIRTGEGASEVLLGEKRHGLGEGKVVAPGGKLEQGESPRQAAVREVAEEVGISLNESDLVLVGELTYLFPTKPAWSRKSWAFVARGDWPDPRISDELDARWVPLDEVPFSLMWDDARHWLRNAFVGVFVDATFEFGKDLSTVSRSDHPRFSG